MHFRDCLEVIPFPVVLTRGDLTMESGNERFHKLAVTKELETEHSTLQGMNLMALFDSWEEWDANLVLARHRSQPFLLARQKPQEEQASTMWIIMDGSYPSALKQQALELERELDAVMESSEDVIYITNPDGMTLRTNTAIKRFSGFPKEAFIGKNVRDLMAIGLLKEMLTFRVVEQGKPVRTAPRVSDSNQNTLKTAIPIFDEKGKIEKVITYVRDLSKQNRLHQELIRALEENNEYKKVLEKLQTKGLPDPGVIVESKQMVEIYDMANRISNVDATVLILGETGVGKDVLARHIYQASQRRDRGEFVKINCGAIPHDLLESELFGYEPGSFTGASRTGKRGIFEQADKGVLFLDEVGELPMALQVKLLRVLQEKQIQRIGATKSKEVDVRLIAATNRDLKQMVKQGTFREDLYYRLNVIPIVIPALRERKPDILPLVRFFLHKLNSKYELSKQFGPCLQEFFYRHHWSGNVRELSNLVERLILTVPSKVITIKELPDEYREQDRTTLTFSRLIPLKEAAEIAEKEVLAMAVQHFHSTYKLAEELGTSQATIVRKLKKYNLTTTHFIDHLEIEQTPAARAIQK
ncbi:sigma 54-interacting transcriptional regulator [Brevibacillus choshinensis]|uniref:sigma-54 interaction domain-containing protein n=1 Tax=Brevibacillus choshinensis TaxID=54911 RepID=UPI002E1A0E2E|nr:sigma 54-interacting transcriptional regulator [Brevibacillus choshinensis]MED4585137.1 sigma 54-interacting transcriptional regulator [Brevibacillus choshinensis]